MNESPKPNNEFERLWRATGHSLRGIRRVWRDEPAFRTEVLILLILIPPAIWLGDSPAESVVLIGVWLLVIAGELINSAIEATIDRIGPEFHDLSGKAKDAASALVLVLLVLAGLVWLAVAVNRFGG